MQERIVLHGDHILEDTSSYYGFRSFLLPSGDGYSIEEFNHRLKRIKEITGASGEQDVTIFAGLDFEEIPFDEIYELWNQNYDKKYVKPSKEEFNSYNHGFFHVLVSVG